MTPGILPTLDVRTVPGEVRMTTTAAGRRMITGYGAVFNSRSQTLHTDDGAPFTEIVLPGAFRKSLDGGADVRGLINHDTRYILGRRGAGTLRLSEDSTGLAYEIDLGTRSYDRDLEESLERKDIVGSSFSFATVDDEWDDENGGAVRQLRAVHLFDVGPVVFPAYRAATSTVRGLALFAEKRSAAATVAVAPPAVFVPTPAQVALLNAFRINEFS